MCIGIPQRHPNLSSTKIVACTFSIPLVFNEIIGASNAFHAETRSAKVSQGFIVALVFLVITFLVMSASKDHFNHTFHSFNTYKCRIILCCLLRVVCSRCLYFSFVVFFFVGCFVAIRKQIHVFFI